MKITTKDHKNYTELWYIESGEIFRPVNSQQTYMRLYTGRLEKGYRGRLGGLSEDHYYGAFQQILPVPGGDNKKERRLPP